MIDAQRHVPFKTQIFLYLESNVIFSVSLVGHHHFNGDGFPLFQDYCSILGVQLDIKIDIIRIRFHDDGDVVLREQTSRIRDPECDGVCSDGDVIYRNIGFLAYHAVDIRVPLIAQALAEGHVRVVPLTTQEQVSILVIDGAVVGTDYPCRGWIIDVQNGELDGYPVLAITAVYVRDRDIYECDPDIFMDGFERDVPRKVIDIEQGGIVDEDQPVPIDVRGGDRFIVPFVLVCKDIDGFFILDEEIADGLDHRGIVRRCDHYVNIVQGG